MLHISLFSGIGGFDLAAEWAGWTNIVSCEINPFGNKVLNHYWPDAYHHDDIHTLTIEKINEELTKRHGEQWRTDDIVLTGGFPCPIHSPENDSAKRMSAICGPRCVESFEKLNPTGSWARMFSALLTGRTDWYSTRCRLIWKLRGTKYKRMYFRLVPQTLRTEGTESGLLLKTPCAADAYTESLTKKEQAFGNSGTLAQEVQTGFVYKRGFLPTPMASDSPEKNTGIRNQDSVAKIAKELAGTTSQLNPRFVLEMMGFPTTHTLLPFQKKETTWTEI
jgi:hypothetical protein